MPAVKFGGYVYKVALGAQPQLAETHDTLSCRPKFPVKISKTPIWLHQTRKVLISGQDSENRPRQLLQQPRDAVRSSTANRRLEITDDNVIGCPKLLNKFFPSIANPAKIAIAGSGFAGTDCAASILTELHTKRIRTPIALTMFEKSSYKQRGGGLAYGEETAGEEHYLNLQVGRVSYHADKPADATRWLQRRYPNDNISAASPIRRRDYGGGYMKFVLRRALYNAPVGSTLAKEQDEVTNAVSKVDSVVLETKSGKSSEYTAVILATGHLAAEIPNYVADEMSSLPSVVVGQYASDSVNKLISRIKENPFCTLLVNGSGLSGSDAVLTAAHHGHKGPVYIVSRNSYRNFTYPKDYADRPLTVFTSPLKKSPFERIFDHTVTAQEFNSSFQKALGGVVSQVKKIDSQFDDNIATEKALEIMRPYIAKAIGELSDSTKKHFLTEQKTYLTAKRIGVVSKTGDVVEGLRKMKQLKFVAAGIESVEGDKDQVALSLSNGGSLLGDIVVFSNGSNNSYDDTDKLPPLWKNLLNAGAAQSNPLGGVRANADGQLLTAAGNAHPHVYVVGVPASGSEAENGEVGPFTLNIPTIRGASKSIATSVVDTIFNLSQTELHRSHSI
jgi:uncharacterized NAD(P)/FAD-binding protein YdhS